MMIEYATSKLNNKKPTAANTIILSLDDVFFFILFFFSSKFQRILSLSLDAIEILNDFPSSSPSNRWYGWQGLVCWYEDIEELCDWNDICSTQYEIYHSASIKKKTIGLNKTKRIDEHGIDKENYK